MPTKETNQKDASRILYAIVWECVCACQRERVHCKESVCKSVQPSFGSVEYLRNPLQPIHDHKEDLFK